MSVKPWALFAFASSIRFTTFMERTYACRTNWFHILQLMPWWMAKSPTSNVSRHSNATTNNSSSCTFSFHADINSHDRCAKSTPDVKLNGKCFRSDRIYSSGGDSVSASAVTSSIDLKNSAGLMPVEASHLATRSEMIPLPLFNISERLISGTVYGSDGRSLPSIGDGFCDRIELSTATSSSLPMRSDHWAASWETSSHGSSSPLLSLFWKRSGDVKGGSKVWKSNEALPQSVDIESIYRDKSWPPKAIWTRKGSLVIFLGFLATMKTVNCICIGRCHNLIRRFDWKSTQNSSNAFWLCFCKLKIEY